MSPEREPPPGWLPATSSLTPQELTLFLSLSLRSQPHPIFSFPALGPPRQHMTKYTSADLGQMTADKSIQMEGSQ